MNKDNYSPDFNDDLETTERREYVYNTQSNWLLRFLLKPWAMFWVVVIGSLLLATLFVFLYLIFF